jgi:iron(III) transport system substrate-binding protein
MRRIGVIGLLGILLSVATGCSRQSDQEVVVYTSVDQVFSEPIFRAFEQSSGIRVRAVFDTEETKCTGVLNRLISEADRPRADVFWSGDPARPLYSSNVAWLAPIPALPPPPSRNRSRPPTGCGQVSRRAPGCCW